MMVSLQRRRKLNVLSLCDGIATGRYVLEKLEIPVEKYYSCEIEPTAIKIAQKNFPDIIELGDLTKLDTSIIKEPIDLVMFGFCCQSLSITMSKTRQHLDGKSSIFWDCLRILKEINPKYFFVENVASMKDDCKEIISKELGVEAIYVNSNQFSAQDRERYYWTNIPHGDVTKEPYSPLVIKDIMETNVPEKYFYTCTYDFHDLDKKTCATLHINGHDILKRVTSPNFKCPTLTRCSGGNHQKKTWDNGRPRKLTPIEYERCQGLPDGFTDTGVSQTARYNALGNGWTVPVIEWFFKGLTEIKE